MLIKTFLIGFKKLSRTMPLAGERSLAISAACHPPATDTRAIILPVKWGALEGIGREEGGIGHCTLTSQDVDPPVKGRLYVGILTTSNTTVLACTEGWLFKAAIA